MRVAVSGVGGLELVEEGLLVTSGGAGHFVRPNNVHVRVLVPTGEGAGLPRGRGCAR